MSFSTFQEIVVNLPAGGGSKRYLTGSFFRIISATHDFKIGVDAQSMIGAFAGLGLAGEADPVTGELAIFNELVFEETLGVANEVTLIVGTGKVFDDRVVFGGTNVPVDVQLPNNLSPGLVKVIPALGGVALLSADADRHKLFLKNVGAVTVWLGVSNGEYGHPIAPGEIIEMESTGLISCYNGNFTQGKLSVLAERVI